MIKIEGPTINLRDWQLSDLDAYLHYQSPGHRWKELDGPYFPLPSPEKQLEMAERIRQRIVDGNFSDPRTRFNIVRKENDELIGQVSCYWISSKTNWLANGIVIYDEAKWGQGIGFESLGLWNDYLWSAFPQIVRLDLRTWSGNHGMMALAQKLGYQEEARFRKARIVKGEHYDSVGYGVLREEWVAKYPAGFHQHLTQDETTT